MKTPEVSRYYTEGRKQEHLVIRWLKEKGYKVKHSTAQEDKSLDVDLWIGEGASKLGISVKTNEPRFFNYPFVFELEVTTTTGRCYPSWYNETAAEYFLVWKRDSERTGKLFLIDVQELKDYVAANGWYKECQTSPSVQEREIVTGKRHTWLGLLDQETAIREGLAKCIGYLDESKLQPEKLTTRRIR